MIYTVTLNPAIDYVVHISDLKPGTIRRTTQESLQFGGKGVNVSTVLGRLGVENVALGFVAGFTGRALEDGLAADGVRTDFIRLHEGFTRINVKIKAGTESEINGRGPAISPDDLEMLLFQLSRLKEGDLLVLAGSAPAGVPEDIYQRILARLEGRGVSAVVDAEKGLMLEALAYRPFLIKPNHLELGDMVGHMLRTEEELVEAARSLQKKGARNVLVSMAGAGALLLDESGGVHRAVAPKGEVRNSVGSGDAMVAGFLAGWQRTGRYEEALRLAVAAGSATAFSEELVRRGEAEALLSQVSITEMEQA